jgi:putative DNA primase/helicase
MSDAASIAKALKGRHCADGYLCRCPLPSHGRGRGDHNPSLLVKDGDTAPLFKCFAGCEPKDILSELRQRGLADVGRPRDDDLGRRRDRPPKHDPDPAALTIWHDASPMTGHHQAGRFLAARGITLAPPPSLRATTINHLDRYPLPALVAAVQAPDRRVIAVQVTLIDPRGDRKAQVRIPRKTVGALGSGAIRLAPAGDVLGLAEGTEKGLAAMQLFGVPCWATLGAGRMHRVNIPDMVSTLHIFVDNDDAGRTAAERTAHEHRHRRVILRFPPDGFKDWDDFTAARAKERSTAA